MQTETGAENLIIGAGASGLMAAYLLAKAGKPVLVLEARGRCGGRIHTVYDEFAAGEVELGAEFIHGDLPVTLDLLRDAGIGIEPANGEMWHCRNGILRHDEQEIAGWDTLLRKLNALTEDIDIETFLARTFEGEQFEALREGVRGFVAGYDTAHPALASAFALRDEWNNEDNDAQYHIVGGYRAMIKFLAEEVVKYGGSIRLNTIVAKIEWQADEVIVHTDNETNFKASKVIIAVPLGVLQAKPGERGAIVFEPALPGIAMAIDNMGFGAIIKVLLVFKEPFWEQLIVNGESLKDMIFLLSDEEIPTWWTQLQRRSKLLTGWLGGPAASGNTRTADDVILQRSLQSLSNIFNLEVAELRSWLLTAKVVNWTNDPFTRGSYAYDKVSSAEARLVLNKPLANKLFFAGEYLYSGPSMGTVEAALTSAKHVAEKILDKKN